MAHFVRDTVREELDLSAILATYDEERGYPPYHPAMMVALLLYGYSRGVYSSRRLARACEERVDFMAVTAMNRPDFRTIAEFRRRHLAALSDLFVQVLELCRAAGLVQLGHVALDGTKIEGQRRRHKAMSYGRMKKAEPELAAEVAAWLAAAEAATPPRTPGSARRRGDEMPEWMAEQGRGGWRRSARPRRRWRPRPRRRSRPERTTDGPAASGMQERGRTQAEDAATADPPDKAQRNFTDPRQPHPCRPKTASSRATTPRPPSMPRSRSSWRTRLTDQRRPTTAPARSRWSIAVEGQYSGRSRPRSPADCGYCSEANLAALADPPDPGYRRHRPPEARPGGRRRRQGCKNGPRSRAPWPRELKRAGFEGRYRLRKQIVEPVFGQIKHARGFRQFLLRGLDKVTGEWAMICTAHNLLKLAAARTA